MPALIQSVEQDFKNYYLKRYQGKALTFCPQMGTALVFATFQGKNVKQLEMSVLQATVLLAFNDATEYTYAAL